MFFLLGAAVMTASTGLPMFYGGRFTVGLGVGAMSMVSDASGCRSQRGNRLTMA